MKYTLDFIVKENGKYFAHIREHDPIGASKEIHTGNLFGWQGATYTELKKILKKYSIELPKLSELILFKDTGCRKCYFIG